MGDRAQYPKYMQAAIEAVELARKNENAFAYERATLAIQLAMLQELYHLRTGLHRGLEGGAAFFGEWMQRIDSQLDALVGSDEESGGDDE